MIFRELLDELRTNILRDNSSLLAGDDDRLWSDVTLARYINEAYRRFARETLIIWDATTPELTQVFLQPGVTLYPLNPAALSVRSVRYHTDAVDLPRASHTRLDTYVGATQDQFFDVNTASELAPGRPRAWTVDEELQGGPNTPITLRVYPKPSTDEAGNVLYLRVSRLPLEPLTLDNEDAELEIPEDYHLDILNWAAYRAYSNHDADGGDATAAEKHKKAFDDCVKTAMQDAARRTFAPHGFSLGNGAFRWSR